MKLNALQERLQKNAVIISARQSIYSRISQEYNAYLKMEDISEVVTKGTTPQTYGFGFVPEGIPFLRAEDVLDGEVCYERTTLFIDVDTNNFMSRSRTCPGDILITIAGTIGRAAVVPETAPELNMNQAVALIRCKKQVNPLYVYHMLQAHDIQQKITESTVTSAISNLSLNKIKDLRIPIPSIEDQNMIALFLEGVHKKQNDFTNHNHLPNYLKDIPLLISKVALLAAKIEEARGLRRETMEEVNNIFDKVMSKYFDFEDITTTVGNYAYVIGGYAFPSDSYTEDGTHQIVRIGNVRDGYLDLSRAPVKWDLQNDSRISRYELVKDDILISMTGTRNKRDYGYIASVPDGVKLLLNQRVGKITPHDPDKLNKFYLAYFLRSPFFRNRLFPNATGTANQANIGNKHIENIPFASPSLMDQNRIVSILDTFAIQLDTLKRKQIDTERELNALLPSILDKAFKGEL